MSFAGVAHKDTSNRKQSVLNVYFVDDKEIVNDSIISLNVFIEQNAYRDDIFFVEGVKDYDTPQERDLALARAKNVVKILRGRGIKAVLVEPANKQSILTPNEKKVNIFVYNINV